MFVISPIFLSFNVLYNSAISFLARINSCNWKSRVVVKCLMSWHQLTLWYHISHLLLKSVRTIMPSLKIYFQIFFPSFLWEKSFNALQSWSELTNIFWILTLYKRLIFNIINDEGLFKPTLLVMPKISNNIDFVVY